MLAFCYNRENFSDYIRIHCQFISNNGQWRMGPVHVFLRSRRLEMSEKVGNQSVVVLPCAFFLFFPLSQSLVFSPFELARIKHQPSPDHCTRSPELFAFVVRRRISRLGEFFSLYFQCRRFSCEYARFQAFIPVHTCRMKSCVIRQSLILSARQISI